ncbi:helix-turn-helix transcriptional regulator [Streptomyces antimycoticus]|uniref:helix-turn-helix transcriptional regulator n=1 Tax=Streptomyces antimycoticus TaxID=68175 RepID=UPI0025705ACC|nr:DNA-binding protein [Streptomyces antimycoticus]WJD99735.1 DNA-binding protein [Streptomyces antimycoticus]
MTGRAAARRKKRTIAELYDQPALMDLPTFGEFTETAISTIYQLAAEGRLPIETVRLGRKRFVRTADVLAWLHLPHNDDSARVAAQALSVEHVNESTSKRNGSTHV